jgi:YD repeat-containing protein
VAPEVLNLQGILVRPVTQTEYDMLGRPTKVTDAESRVTVNTYDGFGKLLTTKDPANIIVTNT